MSDVHSVYERTVLDPLSEFWFAVSRAVGFGHGTSEQP